MTRFRAYFLVALVSIAVAGAACASRSTNSSRHDTIVIGVDLPLAGRDGGAGIMALDAAQLAVAEANNQPDQPMRFELSVRDTARGGFQDPHRDEATDPVFDGTHGAADVATFALEPRLLGVIGPFESNVALAEIPIASRSDLPLVTASARDDSLTSVSRHSSFFRVCTPYAADGLGAAAAASHLGFERVFVVDDDVWREGTVQLAFMKEAAMLKLRIVARERYGGDFTLLVKHIKTSNAAAVVFFGPEPTNVLIMRAGLAEKVLAPARERFMAESGFLAPAFRGSMAAGSADDYYTLWPDPKPISAQATAMTAAFRSRYAAAPSGGAIEYYAAAKILLEAIRNASSACGCLPTRSQVVQALRRYADPTSTIGPVNFTNSGELRTWRLALVTIHRDSFFVSTDLTVTD